MTVYGEVDDDLYETTTIEASSVYVEDPGTYFYASAADEEYDDDYDYWFDPNPFEVGRTTLRGTVTGVDGRESTIDNGPRRMTVDTVAMPYNPLDNKGYQRSDRLVCLSSCCPCSCSQANGASCDGPLQAPGRRIRVFPRSNPDADIGGPEQYVRRVIL